MPRWVARRIRILYTAKYTAIHGNVKRGGNVAKSWKQFWPLLIGVAVGVPIAAILGVVGYMTATATPIHANPQDVPSVTHSAPLPKWAEAVEQGRQIARTSITEQNLPGLSV
jgi:hypothetical protein